MEICMAHPTLPPPFVITHHPTNQQHNPLHINSVPTSSKCWFPFGQFIKFVIHSKFVFLYPSPRNLFSMPSTTPTPTFNTFRSEEWKGNGFKGPSVEYSAGILMTACLPLPCYDDIKFQSASTLSRVSSSRPLSWSSLSLASPRVGLSPNSIRNISRLKHFSMNNL